MMSRRPASRVLPMSLSAISARLSYTDVGIRRLLAAALACTLCLPVPRAMALSFPCSSPNVQQTFTNTSPAGTATGTIQSFAVPASSVTIDAAGAQGGTGSRGGGLGAEVVGTFSVTPGQTLCVLVGGQGGSASNGAGGGGGGSFVYAIASGTCTSNLAHVGTGSAPNLLIAAGGGGGSGIGTGGTGATKPTAAGTTGATAGGNGDQNGAGGGTAGNGGGAVTNSGGGGGLLTSGAAANSVPGGLALVDGALGGVYAAFANGGFGGGGAAAAPGGGGGGYSGGGGGGITPSIGGAGGGGSFSATAPLAPYTQSAVQSGNGAVSLCYAPTYDTTTTLTSSANPSVFGQAVTFTATVSAASSSADTPTGTVTFLDGGSSLGSVALSGGMAAFTTSALAVGNHAITVSYAGDTRFNPSIGSLAGNGQAVAKAATTTTITPPPAIAFGNPVTVTAMVAVVAPGAGTPTGEITVGDGGAGAGDSCTIALPATSCSLTPSSAGSRTLSATYVPDAASASYFNSSSGSATLVVNPSDQTIAFTSTPPPNALAGGTYIVSATTPASGNPVVFMIDAASTAGACTISGNLVSFTEAGTCIVDANAAGNANYAPAAQVQQTIVIGRAASSVALQSSPNPSTPGQQVMFTVTVSVSPPLPAGTARFAESSSAVPAQASPAAVPGGAVMLSDGAMPLATLPLSSGITSFSTSLLTPGRHTITATYSGDAATAPASATLIQTVAAAVPAVPAPLFDRWAILILVGLISTAVCLRLRNV
jgi:hypothetical protein